MSQDQGQERTEQATPKKLKEAREKGQVARSREFNTTAVMLASAAGLLLLGPALAGDVAALFRDALDLERAKLFEPRYMAVALAETATAALAAIAPFLGVTFVAAMLAPIVIGGWSFSLKAIAPKLEKLNPAKGLKRVFGARGLMELAKAMAKFVFVGAVSVVLLKGLADDFLQLAREPLVPALVHAAGLIAWSLLALSTSTLR